MPDVFSVNLYIKMSYSFGRLPHSITKFMEAPRHVFGDVVPPTILDRRSINFVPGLYYNDTLPVCSAVGIINAARAVAKLNGYDLVVEDADVPAFYASVVGCLPTTEAIVATEGVVLLQALAEQERYGFNIGPQSLVAGWKTVNIKSRTDIANTINRLGSIYTGVNLHERDMQTVGQLWDVIPGRDDGGFVGGHAVIIWDFLGLSDYSTVRIGTWGAWQTATWAWVHSRIEEAYGLAWRQLVKASGTYWNGMTPDSLMRLTTG